MKNLDFIISSYSLQRKGCVCVRERERERTQSIQKNRKTILKKNKNELSLTRKGEGAYVVAFSLSSLTRATSYKRGGAITTYYICVIELQAQLLVAE